MWRGQHGMGQFAFLLLAVQARIEAASLSTASRAYFVLFSRNKPSLHRFKMQIQFHATVLAQGQGAAISQVHFVDDVLQLTAGKSSLLAVQLTGASNKPVSAVLTALQVDGQSAWLAHVNWPPGTDGIQHVDLSRMPTILAETPSGELIIKIARVEGAVVSRFHRSILITLEDPASIPRFAFVPNTVAYPGETPTVTVRLVSGKLTQPAILRYQLRPELDGAATAFIPAASTAGFVRFHPGTFQQRIQVPVEWSAVPQEAQYRVNLHLDSFFFSLVEDQQDDIALHIFGVPAGTCPPGTAVGRFDAKKMISVEESNHTVAYLGQDGGDASAKVVQLGTGLSLEVQAGGVAIPLGFQTSEGTSLDIGGMVEAYTMSVTLCIHDAGDGGVLQSLTVTSDNSLNATKSSTEYIKTIPTDACRSSGAGTRKLDAVQAWSATLLPGPNHFAIHSVAATQRTSLPNATLSLVRMANPNHSRLRAITAVGLDGSSTVVCGPALLPLGAGAAALRFLSKPPVDARAPDVEPDIASPSWNACEAGATVAVAIPCDVDTVRVVPELLHPEIPGVRVEVNGQVLSRGGDIVADRQTDTNPLLAHGGVSQETRVDGALSKQENLAFLPAVYLLGLQPEVDVEVNVVVVAEDSVTSARYSMQLRREVGGCQNGVAKAGAIELARQPEVRKTGKEWPPSPAVLAGCTTCSPGWASRKADSKLCDVCPPGRAAAGSGSVTCFACSPGTYSLSWGSSHCKHCIAGTHAPESGLSACLMCPAGMTTAGDGHSQCNVTLTPAVDLDTRYAVVVSFSVYLTGTDPEAVVLKAGVAAPPEIIVGSLLRSDTADAFNISMEDVRVLSVRHVARRILQANVTATLGVDVPADATEEDIAAALAVQRLSADQFIEQLADDPDLFFGRTTKALNVGVRPLDLGATESRPRNGPVVSRAALIVPGALGLLTGAALVIASIWKSSAAFTGLFSHLRRSMRQSDVSQRYARFE
jgi:hypothetical protein